MHFGLHFNLRAQLLTLSAALILAVILPVGVSAHYENFPTHKWVDADPSFLPYAANCVSGMSSSGGDWETAVDDAAANWSAAGTKVRFRKSTWPLVSGSCSPTDPDYLATKVLLGVNPVASTLAWADDYTRICFASACFFDRNTTGQIDASIVTLNAWPGSFDGLSGFGMRSAVVHELGHTLGLAHAGYYAGEFVPAWMFPAFPALAYSVMDYCCVFDRPQSHDVQDINALY